MSMDWPDAADAPAEEDLPGDWVGGEVRHTGGGIFTREFLNPTRQLRIGYDVETPEQGGVDRVRWVEDEELESGGWWEHDGDVMALEEFREYETEAEALAVCLDLLTAIEAGEIDV